MCQVSSQSDELCQKKIWSCLVCVQALRLLEYEVLIRALFTTTTRILFAIAFVPQFLPESFWRLFLFLKFYQNPFRDCFCSSINFCQNSFCDCFCSSIFESDILEEKLFVLKVAVVVVRKRHCVNLIFDEILMTNVSQLKRYTLR